MPNSCSATQKSSAAAHDNNRKVVNDNFNMMTDNKLNEFKSFIISELTGNIKVSIQWEFQNIQEYNNQLEEVSSQ